MKDKNDKQDSIMAKKSESDVNEVRSDRNRRNALKKLLAGSGAIVASQSIPEKWAKPVVDSVMLPGHAQTSGTISANWVLGDDAPGGLRGMTGTSQNNTSGFLYDDGTDSTITAALSPAAPGVVVSLDISVSGTTFTGFDTAPASSVTTSNSGDATFLNGISPSNGDFGDTPGTGVITMTFSAPGYASSVITLNVA